MSTPANFKVCPRCNAALSLAATQCSVCHTSFLPAPVPAAPSPNIAQSVRVDSSRWVVALLLAVFLGFFGVHRFYLGYSGLGAAMLSLVVVGFLTMCLGVGFLFLIAASIWWGIDVILICCNGMKLPDGRPLR